MKKNQQSSNNEDAFILEVNEELKNEKIKQIWEKYGLFIIAVVTVSLTAAISFETIKGWYNKKFQDISDTYSAAVVLQEQEKYDESNNILKNIEEKADNHIYAQLAQFQRANVLLEQNKTDEAIAILQNIIDNEKSDKSLKEVAIIKIASHKLENANFEDIEALLKGMIDENGNWTVIAQEILAMSAIKHKNLDKAKELYASILANPETPENMKNKAQDMLLLLNE